VIEPLNKGLKIYDNPLGVVTNAPTFDWHMTNLRNYINLSATNVPAVDMGGITLAQFGQGSGLRGLPGDFTPPSRFVRAVAFSQSAFPSDTAAASRAAGLPYPQQFRHPVRLRARGGQRPDACRSDGLDQRGRSEEPALVFQDL
jgi:hypothetical protein